jgi:hypothetical protein
MKTVPGIYDGDSVRPAEKVDVKPNTKVLITFLDEDSQPSPFPLTTLDEVAGCLATTGPARTLDEMKEGVKRVVRERWR